MTRRAQGARRDTTNIGVAVFVKTPGLSPVKTRLARGIGQEAAENFYRASVAAVEAALRDAAARSRNTLTPYWAVAEEEALAQPQRYPMWSGFARVAQGAGRDLGARLARVYGELLARHGCAIVVGSDSPQLTAEHVLQAASLVRAPGSPGAPHENRARFVLGPAEDGGFYLFGGAAPISREIWDGVPYSCPDTAETLTRLLRPLGEIARLETLLDVDTPEDLARLGGQWACLAGAGR